MKTLRHFGLSWSEVETLILSLVPGAGISLAPAIRMDVYSY